MKPSKEATTSVNGLSDGKDVFGNVFKFISEIFYVMPRAHANF